jgi:hypothetical protein
MFCSYIALLYNITKKNQLTKNEFNFNDADK